MTSQSQTYTEMSVGEVEAIGRHCQDPFCRQLDFLPFRCESCKGAFCQQHRTEDAHNCSKKGDWARRRREQTQTSTAALPSKPNILIHEAQCASPTCKTLVDTPREPAIFCEKCRRRYCLKHKQTWDHDCANLPSLRETGPGHSRQSKVDNALGRLRAWGAAKKASAGGTSTNSTKSIPVKTAEAPQSSLDRFTATLLKTRSRGQSSPSSSRLAALRTAKADALAKAQPKIPAPDAIFVYLEAQTFDNATGGSTLTKIPEGTAVLSRQWAMGRALDVAAKKLGVRNDNNHGDNEGDRLRILLLKGDESGGRLVDFSEKVGELCTDGDRLVLLRGISPA